MVSTTLRPTKLSYPELHTWQGCANFVSDHIVYQPLECPHLMVSFNILTGVVFTLTMFHVTTDGSSINNTSQLKKQRKQQRLSFLLLHIHINNIQSSTLRSRYKYIITFLLKKWQISSNLLVIS